MIDTYLRHIHGHYGRALRRAKRGREYLLQGFTWEKTACKVLEIMSIGVLK